jgi:hypothetical protein
MQQIIYLHAVIHLLSSHAAACCEDAAAIGLWPGDRATWASHVIPAHQKSKGH